VVSLTEITFLFILIICDNCNFIYIGQTGRNFKTRINEHLKLTKNNPRTSKIAEHILNILHIQRKSKKLDALEIFEIFKACSEGKDIKKKKYYTACETKV
jgi:hypothetical protein